MADDTFSLDELCTLTDLPKRTVRYYIQIELVSRPVGETRAAHYTHDHLEQLLQVKRLTSAGLSLDRIREVLQGEPVPLALPHRKPGSVQVHTHLLVARGIELQISPEEAGLDSEQVRQLVRAVMQATEDVLGKSPDKKKERNND
jgi:DNA-binding transcriptional MerR regulator